MDTTESNDEIPVEKIDRRKIKRTPWRTITLEDGTTKYNSKPNDPEYFKTYYHEKKSLTTLKKLSVNIVINAILKVIKQDTKSLTIVLKLKMIK